MLLSLLLLACSDETQAPEPRGSSPARIDNPGGSGGQNPGLGDDGGVPGSATKRSSPEFEFKDQVWKPFQIWDGSTLYRTFPQTIVGGKPYSNSTLEQAFSPVPPTLVSGDNLAHTEVAFHCKTLYNSDGTVSDCPDVVNANTIGRAAPQRIQVLFDKGIEGLGGEWHTVDRSCMSTPGRDEVLVAGTETLRPYPADGVSRFQCIKLGGQPVGVVWTRTPAPPKPEVGGTPAPPKPEVIYTDWAVLPSAWPVGNSGAVSLPDLSWTDTFPKLIVGPPPDCAVPFKKDTDGLTKVVWMSDWTYKLSGNRKRGGTYDGYNPFALESPRCECTKAQAFTCPTYP